MAIRLVVDSSSDLPASFIEEHHIVCVPLTIIFGQEEFRDKVDISPSDFYEKLGQADEMPTTSQVQPDRFIQAFSPIIEAGDEIICITIGSSASGTCQSAFIAKDELDSDLIHVVDSNSLCMGTGYLAVMAAQMIQEGKSVSEILERITPLTDNRIEHLFCVDTMEYLKRGGRVKAGKAMVAELLNIKPILTVKDAITEPIGKVRGRKKIIPYYLQHIENTMDFDASPFLSVAHSEDEAFAGELIQAFQEKFNFDKPIIVSEIGATIGTHAGPGVLAVFYINKSH